MDVIFDANITNMLSDILMSDRICCATEEESLPNLARTAPRFWEEIPGNYFGRSLYLTDPDFRDTVVPLGDAGVVGFPNVTRMQVVNDSVRNLAASQSPDFLSIFTDQPILNYVLHKTGLGDFEVLNKYCRLTRSLENVPANGRRGIVHFHLASGLSDATPKSSMMKSYLEDLANSDAASVGDETRSDACANLNLAIPGQMSEKELERLSALAREVPPNGCIVEIGALFGLSSWTLAKNAHASVTVYSIDPWVREWWMSSVEEQGGQILSFEAFKRNVSDAQNIIPLRGYSPKDFVGWQRPIDMIFEDSVHTNPVLHQNLSFWVPRVREGGIICGHDYSAEFPDVRSEVDALAAKLGTTRTVFETLWSMRAPMGVVAPAPLSAQGDGGAHARTQPRKPGPAAEKPPAPNLGLSGGDDSLSKHRLRPARDLSSPLDAYPRVLIAILAKQKEKALPLFLRCIEELDYPKSSIVLYVRTNNNTDRTEEILRDWIERVGPSYAGVEFDAAPVEEPVETFGQHEWNATRFRVLGSIRNVSLAKTAEHGCNFYFVCDVDNFIRPCTLRELVALKLPIVAPLLRVTDPNGYYSNFFAEVDPNGFYRDCNQYQWILQQQVRGVFEVPVVHCTYLIRGDVIPRLHYLDGSNRYEFVVFSDSARKAGIQQYIDNRQVYGYVTFDAESDAATGIVGDQRHDQIAFARREIERQHGQKLSIEESSTDTMPTISVMAPRRPSNDFANGFNEFSETIFYGLRHLGYHARIVSRLSEADGQIIVVAANTLSHDEAMQLPADTVIYNAEPFPQVWQVFPQYADEVLRKYKVWDYNPENAKRLSASLGKAVEYVPLGYVPELTRIEKTDLEDIDVLFYGTVNDRRRTILDRLAATGLKVNILCGVFGTERNAWIARSKVVLNVHSHEPGVFEIVRVAFLLANAKAVVSECNPGYAGEAVDADLLPGIVAAKYDDLVEACVSLVADDDRRHAIEQAGFAAFQARRESDILREALAALR